MKYQIIGIIISAILLLVGILADVSVCITAGFVFLLCNIGAIIGIRFKEKKKLMPILLLVGLVAFIIAYLYIKSL